MRALVTGISGFAGHHLAAELLGAGHEVHGVIVSDAEPVPPGVASAHVADITDPAAVAAAFAAVGPELVFHLAGASSVGQSFADPMGTWRVNLDGTLAVLEAMRASATRAPGAWSSRAARSTGASPRHRCRSGPTRRCSPDSPYGASKAAADIAALQYHARVRPAGAARAGVQPRRAGSGRALRAYPTSPARSRWAERDGREHIEMHVGNVDTRRDFSDVRDMVRAYRLVAERGDPDVVVRRLLGPVGRGARARRGSRRAGARARRPSRATRPCGATGSSPTSMVPRTA